MQIGTQLHQGKQETAVQITIHAGDAALQQTAERGNGLARVGIDRDLAVLRLDHRQHIAQQLAGILRDDQRVETIHGVAPQSGQVVNGLRLGDNQLL